MEWATNANPPASLMVSNMNCCWQAAEACSTARTPSLAENDKLLRSGDLQAVHDRLSPLAPEKGEGSSGGEVGPSALPCRVSTKPTPESGPPLAFVARKGVQRSMADNPEADPNYTDVLVYKSEVETTKHKNMHEAAGLA